MQKFRYNFLFVIGLVLIFGTATTAFSQNNRNAKSMGTLSVKTSPDAYPVRVDGLIVGDSGTTRGAEYLVTPGTHLVEVEGPDNQTFSREINFVKNRKNCICLTLRPGVVRECPYDIDVQGPAQAEENEIITFTSRNLKDAIQPVNYKWSVTGGTILSGLGTPSITVKVDEGMGGKTVRAFLDVTDDIPGSSCFQKFEVPTPVTPPPPPIIPVESFECDRFESKSADDDKARFDNCVLQANATPNSKIFLYFYRGTDKRSINIDRLKRRTLDYFVKTRGIDPSQITIVEGGTRPRTTVVVWIVPVGAPDPRP